MNFNIYAKCEKIPELIYQDQKISRNQDDFSRIKKGNNSN